MYNGPFYIPGFMPNMFPPIQNTIIPQGLAARGIANSLGATRGAGLINRLGNGFASLKAINWSGLINGTSKTLGVINQTIPIVKQVGPVMNNMKSMLRVASIFKDETDSPKATRNRQQKQSFNNNTDPNISPINNHTTKKNQEETKTLSEKEDYSPTFFVSS